MTVHKLLLVAMIYEGHINYHPAYLNYGFRRYVILV